MSFPRKGHAKPSRGHKTQIDLNLHRTRENKYNQETTSNLKKCDYELTIDWFTRTSRGLVQQLYSNEQYTFSNGCLGSHNDEERSEMRYVMRIAKSSESSNLWTQLALPSGSMFAGVFVHPHQPPQPPFKPGAKPRGSASVFSEKFYSFRMEGKAPRWQTFFLSKKALPTTYHPAQSAVPPSGERRRGWLDVITYNKSSSASWLRKVVTHTVASCQGV